MIIQLLGTRLGPHEYSGEYVVSYNPDYHLPSGDYDGGWLETTPDRARATRFTMDEAFDLWLSGPTCRCHRLREDGERNQPLTAFHVCLDASETEDSRKERVMTQREMHPPSTVPFDEAAFNQPTPDEVQMNQAYWEGYGKGQMICTGIPGPAGAYDPAGLDDYRYYRTWVDPCFLPDSTEGFPNQNAVGYNTALVDWLNYLWTHDLQSPNRVPRP